MKKILALLTVFAMLGLILAGCAGTPTTTTTAKPTGTTTSATTAAPTTTGTKATVKLKVWGSQEDQAMLKTMTDAFKAANTDANYEITLAVVSEADA